ncbi:peptidoglycan recognition protein-like protein [Dinothrombium tinctorium]|uniref:Peptidoglycan recognition protein-like protein n=1 Tax=Dinothrombium tinctorium TaxID=1965070 RepID=A0A3S3NU11_9ACAR|nr:peptidoglycan recognition protein-like protein [Dinothrombium tinctorium]RWS09120.1 peptidoglycan recognition protein-like protein [Dinothrombium tinctorium]RWS13157.1 peptidoglycan recognition protein-like protein [Dinothrombium tinctorium]
MEAVECCPRIISREEWNAREPRSVRRIPPVKHVFIHHTATGRCDSQVSCSASMRSIQNFHMDSNGWNDIGYNFLIGGDGNIYEGRGWNVEGAHTRGFNRNGIAISFIGNYQEQDAPSDMIEAAKKLIKCGVNKGYIVKKYQLHGHRDANPTLCPGNKLYKQISSWKNFVKGPLRK